MDLGSGLAAATAGGRTLAILVAGYLLLFLLERAWPLRRSKARLLPRLLVNVAVSALAFAAAGALVQPAAAAALGFTQNESFGLMRLEGKAPAAPQAGGGGMMGMARQKMDLKTAPPAG
jgi:hypothetical protein